MEDQNDQDVTIKALRERCAELANEVDRHRARAERIINQLQGTFRTPRQVLEARGKSDAYYWLMTEIDGILTAAEADK